ncbi:hypothetical protein ACVIU7_006430 [Bradyrhizobium liaoningense]
MKIMRHFNADLPKMPLPNWLKAAVIAEVDKPRWLRLQAVPTSRWLRKGGTRC